MYIVIISVIAYSCVWVYVAYRIKNIITGPAQLATTQHIKTGYGQLNKGKKLDEELKISYKNMKVKGYPCNIRFIITDYVIESGESIVTIPKINIKFNPYNNKVSANVDKSVYQSKESPKDVYKIDTNAKLDLKFDKHFLYFILTPYQDQELAQLIKEIKYIKYSDNITANLNLPIKLKNTIKINSTTKEYAKEDSIDIKSSMNIGGPQNIQSELTIDMKIAEPSNNSVITIEVKKIGMEFNGITVALNGNISYQEDQLPYGLVTMQIQNYKEMFDIIQQKILSIMDDQEAQQSIFANIPKDLLLYNYAKNTVSKEMVRTIQDFILRAADKVSEKSLSINIARTKSGDITIGTKSLNSIIEELLFSSSAPNESESYYEDNSANSEEILDSSGEIFEEFEFDFRPEYDDNHYYEDDQLIPNQN
jgi:hypothetical protein